MHAVMKEDIQLSPKFHQRQSGVKHVKCIIPREALISHVPKHPQASESKTVCHITLDISVSKLVLRSLIIFDTAKNLLWVSDNSWVTEKTRLDMVVSENFQAGWGKDGMIIFHRELAETRKEMFHSRESSKDSEEHRTITWKGKRSGGPSEGMRIGGVAICLGNNTGKEECPPQKVPKGCAVWDCVCCGEGTVPHTCQASTLTQSYALSHSVGFLKYFLYEQQVSGAVL